MRNKRRISLPTLITGGTLTLFLVYTVWIQSDGQNAQHGIGSDMDDDVTVQINMDYENELDVIFGDGVGEDKDEQIGVIVENHEYVKILDDPFLPFNLSHRADLMPQNCSPKNKIAFVKTHKTASSTVQNILFRYGYHAGLNIILPSNGNQIIRDKINSTPWHSTIMEQGGYDIWAAHSSWQPGLMRELVQGSAPWVTIIRDPTTLFESGYSYYNLTKRTNGTNLHQFIQMIEDGEITDMSLKFGPFGLNHMLKADFGLWKKQIESTDEVKAKIEELDTQFDLVMLSEMMEESLVLLANLMCLPLHHFVAVKKNSRKEGDKETLSEHEKDVLRSIQKPDEMLYKYFTDKLNERIEDFGRKKMEESIKEFRRLSQEIESVCILGNQNNASAKGTKFHELLNSIVVYRVREDIEECALMGYSEPGMLNMLRAQKQKQYS